MPADWRSVVEVNLEELAQEASPVVTTTAIMMMIALAAVARPAKTAIIVPHLIDTR